MLFVSHHGMCRDNVSNYNFSIAKGSYKGSYKQEEMEIKVGAFFALGALYAGHRRHHALTLFRPYHHIPVETLGRLARGDMVI